MEITKDLQQERAEAIARSFYARDVFARVLEKLSEEGEDIRDVYLYEEVYHHAQELAKALIEDGGVYGSVTIEDCLEDFRREVAEAEEGIELWNSHPQGYWGEFLDEVRILDLVATRDARGDSNWEVEGANVYLWGDSQYDLFPVLSYRVQNPMRLHVEVRHYGVDARVWLYAPALAQLLGDIIEDENVSL